MNSDAINIVQDLIAGHKCLFAMDERNAICNSRRALGNHSNRGDATQVLPQLLRLSIFAIRSFFGSTWEVAGQFFIKHACNNFSGPFGAGGWA